MGEAEEAAKTAGSFQVIRIFIGGLSGSVTENDMEKTFSSLGRVCNVEFIRSNGRSFAFMDFEPKSEKSVAKLFAAYNGCTWKGGKLRLEKAKEHYLTRLKQEWAEDAIVSVPDKIDVGKNEDLKQDKLNLENTKLHIFFPKLKKVKLLPFKGSGKHKYSFQRVDVPALPVHFCDCEEHCGPPERANEEYISILSSAAREKELSIMNSVMNKLFAKDDDKVVPSRRTKSDIDLDSTEPPQSDIQVEETKETDEEDADDLVINIGMQQSDDMLMQLIGKEALTTDKVSGFRKQSFESLPRRKRQKSEPTTTSESTPMLGTSPIMRNKTAEHEVSPLSPKNKSSMNPLNVETPLEASTLKRQDEPTSHASEPAKSCSWFQKSSWRDLVGASGNATFSISHILPNTNLVAQKLPSADNTGAAVPVASKKRKVVSVEEGSKSLEAKENHQIGEPVTHHSTDVSRSADINKTTTPDESGKNNKVAGQELKRTIPKFSIGEVCPFMRSADSEKEWSTAKRALTGYIKKKNNENSSSSVLKGTKVRR
ncbi:protein REPRESSOR OF SILENCING 3 isoform X1 [Typha angustifolia]|uniref:protein REPRESSOR OF SILENCING 3 isoform X1 n=2 Tax=Typha angustifolia TaxID=59011 RepID=UPI003C2CD6CE